MNCFQDLFGRAPEYLFAAPGRTELGGNHTDHQRGKALAAAVSVCCRAQAAENGGGAIRVFSEGFGGCSVALNELVPVPEERGSSAALIRGVAAGFLRRGIEPRGFDAYVRSDVPSGGGLSSSAAFELLIASILNHICNAALSPVELAQIGREAENAFFSKPCGLMDQLACASGGIVGMDFINPDEPLLEKLDFSFAKHGYALCIVHSGADHAGLTEHYASVTRELAAVCAVFGKKQLRDVPEGEFYDSLPLLRGKAGDRAVLRAMHVYDENRRVDAQIKALRRGDIHAFLELARQSGESSWELMQNVTPEGAAFRQELALTIALCRHILGDKGACRVHGGGFAGAVQAFVPLERLMEFSVETEKSLGSGCCTVMDIRQTGAGLI